MGKIHQQVAVADARFFAYHGYYPEEQVLGNEFSVDICVAFNREDRETADELQYTVNYELLYHIAKAEMQQPRKLLETVAESILRRVRTDFPFVSDIEVSVTKHNPPFGGDGANARVVLKWEAASPGDVA
ncbi:dihydroneopterin aldolase [Parapedobacter sp. 10938]|uniref:dihydroneopterin aldolase n=1 Tax=Parapedobacter flavus TaxID=3110225 RepID=UPI002DBAAAC6|nr:dihydroneopterin aldolase [Parapedobacter sp. 10938]MEC3879648.1 dihydroneopterin aldolase [Parapedobacter sp. 10938]